MSTEYCRRTTLLCLSAAAFGAAAINTVAAESPIAHDAKHRLWALGPEGGGTADAAPYGTFTGSPNSAGWIFELAYLPFSHGGPLFWPWLNFRIGLQYTPWTKFDRATTNIDGMGRSASNNNTFFAYIWTMF